MSHCGVAIGFKAGLNCCNFIFLTVHGMNAQNNLFPKIATDPTEDSTEAALAVSEITAEAEVAEPRTSEHAKELVLQLPEAEAVAEGNFSVKTRVHH